MKKGWLLFLIVLFSTSCLHAKITIVTTLFPFYDFANQIGGEHVEVSLLLPPGVEAHSYAPTPKDMMRIKNADLFLYTGSNMEPWVKDLFEGVHNEKLVVVDLSEKLVLEVHDHGDSDHKDNEMDLHYWLDPHMVLQIVERIAHEMIKVNPDNKAVYQKNTEHLILQLKHLEKETTGIIAQCYKKTVLFAGHNVFGYFGDHYGLTFINAYPNFSPNARPTPKTLVRLVKLIKQKDIKVIYHEELIDPKIGEVLAAETGATLMMLHGAPNLTKEEWAKNETYISLMKENAEKLKIGLDYRKHD